jgi:hypothetical protein
MFSRKSMLNSFAFGTMVCSAGVSSAVACDPPAVKPALVSTSFAVVVQSRTVKSVEEQLASALKTTQEFVHTCHSEVDKASKEIDAISGEQAKIIETQKNAVEKITALRNLLSESGCSVCIDGKSFSKETIAKVLLQQLEGFQTRESQLDAINIRLRQAKTVLAEAKVKAERWKSAEQLLISRVDKVLGASAVRLSLAEKEAVAKEAAEAEALALADAIEVKIAKTKKTDKPVSRTASTGRPESGQKDSPKRSLGTSSEVGTDSSDSQSEPLQAHVTEAIAEFDAIFGK